MPARLAAREDLRLAMLHAHSAHALDDVASVERHLEQKAQCGERDVDGLRVESSLAQQVPDQHLHVGSRRAPRGN